MQKKYKQISLGVGFLLPVSLATIGSIFLFIFYEPIFGYSVKSGVLVSLLIGLFLES